MFESIKKKMQEIKQSKDFEKDSKPKKIKEDPNEPKKPDDLSFVSIRNVDKIYPNKVQAVSNFNLDIKKKEFIVLVGPSGCGKSTTLRMIAGLEDITHGQLWINGAYSNNRTPKDRDISMVFQSYALYPHMSVYDNMAFGLKIRHLPKEEIDKRVREAAKILQIEPYLDRRPKALSGGQRQRVALGRAIVRKAQVFLMDEPLSNLDAKLRVKMRSEIVKLHESLGATTVYVTHDQTEAMTMATRIVVMNGGFIQQIGSPIDIYNKPANLFVATFIGSPAMNILKATYNKGEIILMGGKKLTVSQAICKAHDDFYNGMINSAKEQINKNNNRLVELNSDMASDKKTIASNKAETDRLNDDNDKQQKQINFSQRALREPHEIAYGARPEDIRPYFEGLKNVDSFEAEVTVAELLGHDYYVHVNFGGIDLVSRVPYYKPIKPGDKIKLYFDEIKSHIFDTFSEKTIY